jgi:hypothetical protein
MFIFPSGIEHITSNEHITNDLKPDGRCSSDPGEQYSAAA